MRRIPYNLREWAIGMLDAGMSTEHVAKHVGCSSPAIRNLRIRFQTTGSTNDLPRRGRPRVTTRRQDRIVMKTHSKLPLLLLLTHMGFIITESVRENGLHARCPYVGGPLIYFSFQTVLHDWCNKGRGMCYPACI